MKATATERRDEARARAAVAAILADPDTSLYLATIPGTDVVRVYADLEPAPRFGIAPVHYADRYAIEIDSDGYDVWSYVPGIEAWDEATEPEDFDGSRSYRGPVDSFTQEAADRYLAKGEESDASPWASYLADALADDLLDSPVALRRALLPRA